MADMDFSQAFTYSDIQKVYLIAVELENGAVSQHGSVQLERIFQDSTLYAQVSALKNEMESILQNFTGASEYDDTATYAVGDYCTKDDYLYQCNTAVSAESWDASKWDVVTISSQYTMLKNILGVDDYSTSASYAVGDLVVYDGKMYRCITAVSSEAWDASKWSETSFVAEVESAIAEIQNEGATQIANVQSVYSTDLAEVNAKVSRNTKEIANLVQKEGEVSISYPDSIYGRGEVPSGMAKYAEVSCLRGVSRVGNNIITNGNFESVSGWSFAFGVSGSFSVADNIAKIIFGNNNSIFQIYKAGSYLGFSYTSGHSYLVFVKVRLSVNASVRVIQYETNNIHYGSNITVSANQWTLVPILFTAGASGQFETNVQSISGMSQGDVIEAKEFVVTDLTLYFGSDPSVDVSALTIADIQQKYPELLIPSDYDTGSLVDITYSAVDSQGVNLWDEEWEVGSLNISNGENATSTQYSRSVDYIPCSPSTTYYGKTSSNFLGVLFYGIDKTYIAGQTWTDGTNRQFTSIANAYYMRFVYEGQTYNHDIQICLNSLPDAVKTTYHPYMTDTLTLPSPVTLSSAGSVADTDELCVEVDGVEKRRKTVRIGAKTFASTDQWIKTSSNSFYLSIPEKKTGVVGLNCSKYPPYGYTTGPSAIVNTPNMIGQNSGTNAIYFYSAETASLTEAQFASYMEGVVINYALANESVTLLDPILDNFVLTEAGGTITPIQTQSKQIDTRFDMNYMAL